MHAWIVLTSVLPTSQTIPIKEAITSLCQCFLQYEHDRGAWTYVAMLSSSTYSLVTVNILDPITLHSLTANIKQYCTVNPLLALEVKLFYTILHGAILK